MPSFLLRFDLQKHQAQQATTKTITATSNRTPQTTEIMMLMGVLDFAGSVVGAVVALVVTSPAVERSF